MLGAAIALAACDASGLSSGDPVRPKAPSGNSAGKPGATAQPAAPQASPTAKPDGVGGTVGAGQGGSQAGSTARKVSIDPRTATLNAPSADGTNAAGFEVGKTFEASVLLLTGQADDQGVTWSVSDATRLAVDAAGRVSVKAGATPGAATVTAASKRTPAITDQAVVTIASDGLLKLTILPTASFDPLSMRQTTVNLTGPASGSFGGDGDVSLRLVAGSNYQVLIKRQEASGSTTLRAVGKLTGLSIAPNAIATATVTLQATDSF